MTNIYNYYPNTMEYISTSIAELDPIDSLPLVPMYSTTVPVIKCGEGFVAVFDGRDAWVKVMDVRGVVYNTTTKAPTIHQLLGPLPPHLTDIAPPPGCNWVDGEWVIDWDELRNMQNAKVAASYRDALKAGHRINGMVMSMQPHDITNIESVISWAGRTSTETAYIQDISGNVVDVTAESATAMIDELATQSQSLLIKLNGYLKTIATARDDKEAIESVIWESKR